MYICNCKGINEKSLKNAINDGISTMCTLKEKTSLGSCCGKCVNHAKKFLEDQMQKSS